MIKNNYLYFRQKINVKKLMLISYNNLYIEKKKKPLQELIKLCLFYLRAFMLSIMSNVLL